jgi:ATP-binding cassette subfamily B protein
MRSSDKEQPAKLSAAAPAGAASKDGVRPQPPASLIERGEEEEARFRPISMALVMRLAGWLKPYWKLYAVGTAAGIVSLLLDLCGPKLQQIIIDEALPSRDANQVFYWASIWAVVVLFVILLDAVQIYATNRCGEQVITDMRMAVFAQLQRLPMSFYDRTKLGRIITRGTSDMDSLRGPVVSGINTVAFNILLMIGAAVMILVTDWRLFLAVCWLAPVLAFSNMHYRRVIGEAWQVARAGFSRVASNLAENITGVRVVTAFNRQDENLERFNELQEENTQNNVRCAHINGLYQPFLEFVRFCGQVIILAYGGALVMRGSLMAGQVVAVFFYWDRFMGPTINMGNFYNTLMQAMASGERVFELLDRRSEVADKPDAKPLPRVQGHIHFDGVTFGYDPARPVLHDIKLEVPPGKTFALVGATGSGKSSTISLLARFYQFQQGRILVDGNDIRDATAKSLHQQMGMVLQANYLFSGTVLDNMRYPRPSATEEEVREAAKALGIHDVFDTLPQGYHTVVGERGASVSVGMRQLICFTRVLVANPRIFLLDEATSAIDTVTEMRVQTALERLVQGRTTVIVAHRLSTIVKADCIVVLADGRIIEQGTHAELLAANGNYATMYQHFVAEQAPSRAPAESEFD